MNIDKVYYFEHRFWLQIIGDHCRFIVHALSPDEVELIQQAQSYVHIGDQLLEHARAMDNAVAKEWIDLSDHAFRYAEQVRQYKLLLIYSSLGCQVNINLPPTFINHMVNEAEEYLRILGYLIRGIEPPKLHPVHHHQLWLLDAAGHAASISNELDPVEKKWIHESQSFQHTFEDFYIQAREMAGFIRARQDMFAALHQFNQDTSMEIDLFYHFLRELEEMRLDCKRLGTLMPLMADHMAREECYYMLKLAEIDPDHVKQTQCDPTKARVAE